MTATVNQPDEGRTSESGGREEGSQTRVSCKFTARCWNTRSCMLAQGVWLPWQPESRKKKRVCVCVLPALSAFQRWGCSKAEEHLYQVCSPPLRTLEIQVFWTARILFHSSKNNWFSAKDLQPFSFTAFKIHSFSHILGLFFSYMFN